MWLQIVIGVLFLATWGVLIGALWEDRHYMR
jgi:hypothetical protein